jgi:hypothetical protein
VSDRTDPETPTLAEAARAVLGLWDVSDTRPTFSARPRPVRLGPCQSGTA